MVSIRRKGPGYCHGFCFGTFIKQIEDNEPILTDERFEDYDNIYKSWKEDFRNPFAQAMKLDAKTLKRKKKGDK